MHFLLMYCCVFCLDNWMIVCLCDWCSLWWCSVLCVVFYLDSLEISSVAALGISVIGPHVIISASRPTHTGRPDLDKIFQTTHKIKIPNLHIVRYMCQFEQYLSHRQNERRAHPSWAPTKEPTVSYWRYTPSPNLDRFQDFLEAICPDFQHTILSK